MRQRAEERKKQAQKDMEDAIKAPVKSDKQLAKEAKKEKLEVKKQAKEEAKKEKIRTKAKEDEEVAKKPESIIKEEKKAAAAF